MSLLRRRREWSDGDRFRFRGAALRANDDVDFAAEGGEKAHEPFDGEIPEPAAQHARDVGLANAHDLRGLGLTQLSLENDVVNATDQARLEQMGFRFGVAEIGKNIPRPSPDGLPMTRYCSISDHRHGDFTINY